MNLFATERELWGSVIYTILLLITLWATFRFGRGDEKSRARVLFPVGAALLAISLIGAVTLTIILDALTTEDVCIYVILGLWTLGVIAGALFLIHRLSHLRRYAVVTFLAIATLEVLGIPPLLLGS